MTKTQAEEMLREAFGSGDLGNEIDKISEDETADQVDMGDRLIDWIAGKLSDEKEAV